MKAMVCLVLLGMTVGSDSAYGDQQEIKQNQKEYDEQLAYAIKSTASSCLRPIAFVVPKQPAAREPVVVVFGHVIRAGADYNYDFALDPVDTDVLVLRYNGKIVGRRSMHPKCRID